MTVRDTITIRLGFDHPSQPFKSVADRQQIERGNEANDPAAVSQFGDEIVKGSLLSETESALFIRVPRMTIVRRRNVKGVRHS